MGSVANRLNLIACNKGLDGRGWSIKGAEGGAAHVHSTKVPLFNRYFLLPLFSVVGLNAVYWKLLSAMPECNIQTLDSSICASNHVDAALVSI